MLFFSLILSPPHFLCPTRHSHSHPPHHYHVPPCATLCVYIRAVLSVYFPTDALPTTAAPPALLPKGYTNKSCELLLHKFLMLLVGDLLHAFTKANLTQGKLKQGTVKRIRWGYKVCWPLSLLAWCCGSFSTFDTLWYCEVRTWKPPGIHAHIDGFYTED